MMFNLENAKRVMVFAAHPDDEIIGSGGTLHKLASQGKEISVVTFTLGGTAAKSPKEAREMEEIRKKEMKKVDSILGIKNRISLKIPTQQVYRAVFFNNKLHHKLIELIRKYKPDILFSHYLDLHRDHNSIFHATKEVIFQAAESILLNLGESWKIPLVLFYGVEQRIPEPNIIIKLEEENLNAKISALKTQLSQIREGYLERWKQTTESRTKEIGVKFFGSGSLAEEFLTYSGYPVLVG